MGNKRIILHLDMNSYFASVEQQANPFFRNKPVGVCAYLSANGCIIASSVEAKKLGIKTGCRVKEAKNIYPKIILVENDPNKYRSVTRRFFLLLAEYTDSLEPYSIDEAFLDLTGWVKDFTAAEKLAREIRVRVKNEIGDWLKMSIGVSYTKFLAKLCSDSAAADQTKIVSGPLELDELYKDMQLTDVWGINKRLQARLNGLGIYSIQALRNYPLENLMVHFGKYGYYLWNRLNGFQSDDLAENAEPKSIGHSYCLPKIGRDKAYLSAVLFKLCQKVGARLWRKNLQAQIVSFRAGYLFGGGFGESKRIITPLKSGIEIYQISAQNIFQQNLADQVNFLAVSVSGLLPYSNQLSLFDYQNKKAAVDKVLNDINGRFGDNSIYQGKLWGLANQAVDRIGFRKIEGVLERETIDV